MRISLWSGEDLLYQGGLTDASINEREVIAGVQPMLHHTLRANPLLPCGVYAFLSTPATSGGASGSPSVPSSLVVKEPFAVAFVLGSIPVQGERTAEQDRFIVYSLVCTSRYPCFSTMSAALRMTDESMKRIAPYHTWAQHQETLFDSWVRALNAVSCPKVIMTNSGAYSEDVEDMTWQMRIAPEPLMPKYEVIEAPVSVLVKSFPGYDALRTLQSIMMTTRDVLLVCSPFVQVASAIAVSLPLIIAPFAVHHRITAYASGPDAWRIMEDGSAVIGIAPHSIPVLMVQLHLLAEPLPFALWVADCRTGRVARLPSNALMLRPPPPLVLIPVLEKLKELWQRPNEAMNAASLTESVINAQLDGMRNLFGQYRRALDVSRGVILAQKAVTGANSGDVCAIAFAQRVSQAPCWARFQAAVIDIERNRGGLLVPAIRDPGTLTSGGSLYLRAVAVFVARCAERYPDPFLAELNLAGRPPKEQSAGKMLLGFFGKAKDVVAQIGVSAASEVPSNAPSYCQCDDVFQAPVSKDATAVVFHQRAGLSSSSTGRSTAPVPSSCTLPLDVVHYFDLYHPLLGEALFGSRVFQPRGPASVAAVDPLLGSRDNGSVTPSALTPSTPTDTSSPVAPQAAAPVVNSDNVLDALFGSPAAPSTVSTPQPQHTAKPRDLADFFS